MPEPTAPTRQFPVAPIYNSSAGASRSRIGMAAAFPGRGGIPRPFALYPPPFNKLSLFRVFDDN